MANLDDKEPVAPEKPLATPHDTYVYKMLSDPALAAAEFKHVLPKEIGAEIEWDILEQDTNRFSDENLDNHYTDLLFKTKLRGRPIKLRLLLEHSSYDKPFELLQALRYQVEQWERESKEKKEAKDKQHRLTPIITVILHHSETGWRGRPRFVEYFGLDEDLARLLKPFVVDFGIVLDDISKVNTEALIQRPVQPTVKLMLFALRFARDVARNGRTVLLDELPKMVPVIEEVLQGPNGRLAMRVFLVYVKAVAKVSEADVQTSLQELIESRLHPEMMAAFKQLEEAQRAYREGQREGELRGELRGVLKGQRESTRSTLQRQLTHRFGALTPAAVARLESATLDELDAMTLRVLTAATVDEVLGGS